MAKAWTPPLLASTDVAVAGIDAMGGGTDCSTAVLSGLSRATGSRCAQQPSASSTTEGSARTQEA